MRLNEEQARLIRATVQRECGNDARVRLFGSRLDDSRRGGDIDILVELSQPVERPALLSATLSTAISRVLSGRAVDIVLSAPNLERGAIHRAAERGQLL